MFASYLGAEIKTNPLLTAVQSEAKGLCAVSRDTAIIMPEYSENCNTQTQEILESNRHLSRNTELVQKEI